MVEKYMKGSISVSQTTDRALGDFTRKGTHSIAAYAAKTLKNGEASLRLMEKQMPKLIPMEKFIAQLEANVQKLVDTAELNFEKYKNTEDTVVDAMKDRFMTQLG